ncbi:MAG TPA: OmpA family protein [Kofleriaceae bacterium]|nr:OmpA family protein [Kofleriaceae bacterium]
MKTTRTMLALALAFAAGCHHDKKATTTPTATNDTPPPAKQDKPAPAVTQDQKVSNSLAISGDLAQLCGIKPTPSALDPKFAYDKDELTSDDRNVLDQLAQCLISGAGKGKAVSLIGRADPRGTEEYNLGLGSRRAASVSKYLEHLGVQDPQLAVTTRGALDATGTDEAGWANDRRVDVQLKQD